MSGKVELLTKPVGDKSVVDYEKKKFLCVVLMDSFLFVF